MEEQLWKEGETNVIIFGGIEFIFITIGGILFNQSILNFQMID
jgi:hypothetical protein